MSQLVLFEQKQVRRAWHGEAWWFVLVDVVVALTDSANPPDYLKKLKKRDRYLGEAFKGGGQIVPPLALRFATPGGPQKLQCWDSSGILRLIQSIPSPKAEPFKRWLAQVGSDRLREIEDPEIGARRMREIYRQKGYSEAWIEKRMRGIAMLGEASTTEIARNTDAQGFPRNKVAAKQGGGVAGNARRELETKSGRRVSTRESFKEVAESQRRLRDQKKGAAT